MSMTRSPYVRSLLAAAVLTLTLPGQADALPIFAGSTYDPNTVSGDRSGAMLVKPDSAVNNLGRGIGWATHVSFGTVQGERAIAFTPTTSAHLQPLVTLPSGQAASRAYAINPSGIAVGTSVKHVSSVTNHGNRPVRWGVNGLANELQVLGVSSTSQGHAAPAAINASGVVTGVSEKYSPNGTYLGTRAVRWASNSNAITELGGLGDDANGVTNANGFAINNAGTIVGAAERYNGNTFQGLQAVRWGPNSAVPVLLGSLGVSAGMSTSVAYDVSENAIVVGMSHKYDSNGVDLGTRAVRWPTASTTPTELGTLGGTDIEGRAFGEVHDISADGSMIVGVTSRHLLGTPIGDRAAYWAGTGSAAATELPHLGLSSAGKTDTTALAVNGSGAIAGIASKHTNGGYNGLKAVVWTTAGTDAVIDLNTLLPANSGWTTLSAARGISDTGFVTGVGKFDVDGAGVHAPYDRLFIMLVPQAGTYGKGDANFDTLVNFDDLLLLSQNYGDANAAKAVNVADFNLDGNVNFDDLLVLSQNYGVNVNLKGIDGISSDFAADWALAQSLVPEPTSMLACGVVAMSLLGRRRA